MTGWHHQLNRHEFEQTPGDSETEQPGMLQSTGSQRVRNNLVTEKQQHKVGEKGYNLRFNEVGIIQDYTKHSYYIKEKLL